MSNQQRRNRRHDKKQVVDEKDDSSTVDQQSPAPEYDQLKLHKNNTLLIMSFAPDQRTSYFMRHAGFEMDEPQMRHADRICREYDDQYLALQRKRASLMSDAPNIEDIANKRMAIRQEIFNLNEVIKSRIHREVKRSDQAADFEKKKEAKNSINK